MVRCSFTDDRGREVPAVDAARMREVDRIAIEETGPNLYQMMENAGRNLALEARAMAGSGWQEASMIVLAGTGGNGGGGITAARHLANHGGAVAVVVTDEPSLGEVPAQQLALFRHTGGAVVDLPDRADLVIDAVVGYSLRGAPRGRALELIEWANAIAAPVLALDVPSGIDASTGAAPGIAVGADRTLTLALPKHGLCAPAAGEIVLADIGIPAAVYHRLGRAEAAAVFRGRYRVPLHRRLGPDD